MLAKRFCKRGKTLRNDFRGTKDNTFYKIICKVPMMTKLSYLLKYLMLLLLPTLVTHLNFSYMIFSLSIIIS